MTLRLFLTCLVIGIAGWVLMYGGFHLYEDHQRLHLVDAQVGVWQQEALKRQAAAEGVGK